MVENAKQKVITGIKFKLKLDKDLSGRLTNYFDEYGKAINFSVGIIQKELFEDKFAGKLKLDENKKPILDNDEKKIYEYPDDLCSCGNQVRRYVNGKPFCQECYKKNFTENGLRKRMYSTRGRKAEPKINVKNSTNKISKTHFNYAIREAFILDKSIKEQRKKRFKKLELLRKKLQEFIDIKDGKRIVLPMTERQRAERYIHPSWKPKDGDLSSFRGYSLNIVSSKIKIFDRNIKREEKSLREKGQIKFKARRLMLGKSVKFSEEGYNQVSFTISKDFPKKYNIEFPKKEKRLEWLKEKIDLIKNQDPKYAYLLREGNEFYLQYTIQTIPEMKETYSGSIGIDRGISHIAVLTFVSNEDSTSSPKFFSSSEILRLRNLQKERNKFLRGKHNKLRKIKNGMRNIEPMINLILHEYSKKIVDMAKENNAFITFENLEKIKKSRIRMSKKSQYKLSLFTFKKLSDLVDYKAKREGIKVLYVPPEYTSKECSHCGEKIETQRPFNGNSSLFKCNKCGIQINADYNASINIAKKGLKIINPQ